MDQKSLYERLGGYDGITALPAIYCRAYKQILNWLGFGRTAVTMG